MERRLALFLTLLWSLSVTSSKLPNPQSKETQASNGATQEEFTKLQNDDVHLLSRYNALVAKDMRGRKRSKHPVIYFHFFPHLFWKCLLNLNFFKIKTSQKDEVFFKQYIQQTSSGPFFSYGGGYGSYGGGGFGGFNGGYGNGMNGYGGGDFGGFGMGGGYMGGDGYNGYGGGGNYGGPGGYGMGGFGGGEYGPYTGGGYGMGGDGYGYGYGPYPGPYPGPMGGAY
uniref:DUF148 domain-containing protein n=1 Tax=Heterorhabditis bacteriophora TaxID=37862 RepID=A0A1I7W9M6_HETBA